MTKVKEMANFEFPGSLKKLNKLFFTKQFIVFICIGVVNTLNGIIFEYLYSLIYNVNLAFILGYLTSLVISYFLNSLITFRDSLSLLKGLKFSLAYIPNFLIQNLIVIIFYDLLKWHKLIVYILAAGIGMPVTFLLMKVFVFKRLKRVKPLPPVGLF